MNAFALYIDRLCNQMATGTNGRGGQERLAELLGVNPSVIGLWRKGQDIRRIPTLKRLVFMRLRKKVKIF